MSFDLLSKLALHMLLALDLSLLSELCVNFCVNSHLLVDLLFKAVVLADMHAYDEL